MLYLLCNIVCASSFMLFIKWMSNRGREDIVTAGAVNYIVAFLAAIPMAYDSGLASISHNAWLAGSLMGISYFCAFFFAMYAVRWIGASGSTVISALSLIVPIVCGVFVWNERPNAWQVGGIGLALMSLVLIGTKNNPTEESGQAQSSSSGRRSLQIPMLLAFFVLCGSARLAQAAFKHVCVGEPAIHFTLTSFAMAAIPSLLLLLARRKPIRGSEFAFGAAMGLANSLQIQFIILSLESFDSFIVFPVISAGGLMLTTLIATQFLSERLSMKAVVGIALACIALILLNVRMGA